MFYFVICFFFLLLKVAKGEVTDFDQCLCTLEFLDKLKPLQKILKEKMPTTRRGIEIAYRYSCTNMHLRNSFFYYYSNTKYAVITNSKWFEPGSNSRSCAVIVQVRVVLKRTVVGDSD